MKKIAFFFSKQELLKTALTSLHPSYIQIIDDSHKHSKGLETHFRITIGNNLMSL